MEIYQYQKFGKTLYFDKFAASYGEQGETVYYRRDSRGYMNSIKTKDLGKVKDGKCFLLERDDNKALELFIAQSNMEIEDLRARIVKLQEEQKAEKVVWFRNGEGTLEQTNL